MVKNAFTRIKCSKTNSVAQKQTGNPKKPAKLLGNKTNCENSGNHKWNHLSKDFCETERRKEQKKNNIMCHF